MSTTGDNGMQWCTSIPAIDARTRGAAPNEEKNPCSSSASMTPASAEGKLAVCLVFQLHCLNYDELDEEKVNGTEK